MSQTPLKIDWGIHRFTFPGSVIDREKSAHVSYLKALEVAKGAPSVGNPDTIGRKTYPHEFSNHEGLEIKVSGIDLQAPVQTPVLWVIYPIRVPEYQGPDPGPLRVLYDENTRTVCALIYHIINEGEEGRPFAAATLECNGQRVQKDDSRSSAPCLWEALSRWAPQAT
ncbi:hypothetical protein QBC39DRAFT_329083 [Podospora conica]|nr:hypothetical protein QBC39DRAFT_329083 [Schizothecium conicum]